MYENGVMLRLKYQHLLPSGGFFRLSNMRIVSSVPERTIMSLQSFMAGFLPPPLHQSNLPIFWQPFPFDIDYDGKLVYMRLDNSCPVFLQHAYMLMMNPPAEVAAWMAADKEAFKAFSQKLGSPISTIENVLIVSDALKIQMGIDPTMPQWAKDGFTNTFQKYGVLSTTMLHKNPTMIKIRGGPMLTEMVNNMVAVANGNASGKKVLLYSAHDITVSSLAYALGVEEQIPRHISYSDSIMVDLVGVGSGEASVEVIYMDNANKVPKAFHLSVPGCGKSCSLSRFRQAVQGMMVDDYKKLCGL